MAFATKYTVTFKDFEDLTWVIYFREDGWGGGVTTLTPSATPLSISFGGGDKYQPIRGSSVDIGVVYESAVDDLYVEESQTIQVSIEYDSTVIWGGYLTPGQYYRQFTKPKHYVTFTATDGLGQLKDMPFEDDSGDPYFYLMTEMDAISAILYKTGVAYAINDAVNIYDTNQNSTSTDSPLDQTYFYPEMYWNEKTDERGNCYQVLEDILKKYGATIRQSLDANRWIIIRPNSYSVNTVPYRVFSYLGVYVGATTLTSYVSIDSNLKYINADHELSKLLGVGKCYVTVNPPRRDNFFKNGSFDAFTWTLGVPDYWTDTYSSGTSIDISAAEGGIKLGSNGNAATPTEYIEATINMSDISSATITFDWEPNYTGAPSYKDLVFQIYDGNYYLTSSGWQSGVGYYTFTAPALSTGLTFKGQIDIPAQYAYGYDRSFPLRVRIYEFHNENSATTNYVLIDNLRLEANMEMPETRIYSHDNTLTITNSNEIEIALGDSWITDYFASATEDDAYFINNYNTSGGLTSSWSIFGDPTAGAPIAEVLARQTVEGFRRSLDVLRGTLRTKDVSLPYVAIRDSNFTDEYGFEKSFFPNEISYNARRNEWNGEWVELPATYTDEGIEWASSDYDTYTIGPLAEPDSTIAVTTSGGDGTATSDPYAAVAGETVRVVFEITDSGSSDLPTCEIGGVAQTIAWGVNYLEVYFSTAGNKTIVLGGDDPGDNHNYWAFITGFYSITGI